MASAPSHLAIDAAGLEAFVAGEGVFEPFDAVLQQAVPYFTAKGLLKRSPLQLSLESLVFQRTLLFTGKPIEIDGAIHAEQSTEGILVVGAPAAPPPGSKVLPFGFERNLLCGVADATGRCLGLGRWGNSRAYVGITARGFRSNHR